MDFQYIFHKTADEFFRPDISCIYKMNNRPYFILAWSWIDLNILYDENKLKAQSGLAVATSVKSNHSAAATVQWNGAYFLDPAWDINGRSSPYLL